MGLFTAEPDPGADSRITIVSGLPRSGTSMVMKMLEAGGLAPLTDEIRQADNDNPRGYYEFEPVKKLETDQSWLPRAKGKAVKIISMLLRHLPLDYTYKVIFIRRHLPEVLASQKQMLVRRGEPADQVSDEEMARIYGNHLRQMENWLNARPAFDVLYVNHRDIIDNPAKACRRINKFLGGRLDVRKMAGVVDNALYRQRRP